MKEVWKYVVGYEKLYKVSNTGKVWTIKYNRLMTPIKKTHGYLDYKLNNNYKVKNYKAHRLVALHFIPNPLNLPQINHLNHIKTDNRVGNLQWCTQSENIKHAVNHGLIRKGEDIPWHKLTESQVREIKLKYGKTRNITRKEIAQIYGCSTPTIGDILKGRSWMHILI